MTEAESEDLASNDVQERDGLSEDTGDTGSQPLLAGVPSASAPETDDAADRQESATFATREEGLASDSVATSELVTKGRQMLSNKRGKAVLAVAVTFSLFAAFALLPQLTRRSRLPPPFFHAPTSILDFPDGDLTKLSLRVLEHEVTFVLYYAHWDLDSIRYKASHEAVAEMYSQEVFFAAINCWWPDGECSKVMRLRRFPLLLAHVRNVGDVEYRGPLVSSYIIPFLDNLLEPVVPIRTPGDLIDLRATHDVSRHLSFTSSDLQLLLLLSGGRHALL